jgi:threonine dehydratase
VSVRGWRCATCGADVGIDQPLSWRCPRAVEGGHHVLALERDPGPLRSVDDPNPLLAFHHEFAWTAFAAAHGLGRDACEGLVRELDAAVERVDGTGFRITPCRRSATLSAALGFTDAGGVWVKDETNNVAGSHKARHLVSILLHLLVAEWSSSVPWSGPSTRPPLAISSCGNAALAAATLAAAAEWPVVVFVPPWADPWILGRLGELRAEVQVCPRRDGDPPGDPCVHRFREAVGAGAVPFGVQGPENAWCLDAGRTLGWELALGAQREGITFDRVFVQVGGGAFASCTATALAEAKMAARFHAVQTEGCAPLARAWRRAGALSGGLAAAAAQWSECMWPWEQEPHSAADGILDDEAYDGLAVLWAMDRTDGWPVVVTEAQVVEAHRLAVSHTGLQVSPTGTAGLAGVLALVADGAVGGHERVAVVFSGRSRPSVPADEGRR